MGADAGPIELVFSMFYIRADGKHIVVDTGVSATEETAPHHHPMNRSAEQDPILALARVGVSADEIDIVINTHLHWDHCANNHLFSSAAIFAQRAELQFAIAPLPMHRLAYDEVQLDRGDCVALPGFLRSRLTLVEGDLEVTPSVRILHTPGHTPGSQSVFVRGSRSYLLPGDNVPFHENLPGGFETFRPNPLHVDLESYFASMRRSLAGIDLLLPGHDHRSLDYSEYH